jgi:hypothetical protein
MQARALCLLSVVMAVATGPLVADSRHAAEEAGITSGSSIVEARITFVNDSHTTIRVYWLDFRGARVLYHTLKPGEAAVQVTYLGHPWLITDEDDNAWQIYYPDAQPRKIKIERQQPGQP